ncbi:MAG: glutamine-hydrolyzing carbamoyl-phosphate synthase small subunit, partial [Deferrisomatales bacterium]
NWRATRSLHAFLKDQGVVGIQGIDTRALTRRLRTQGSLIGVISTEADPDTLVDRARAAPAIEGRDLVREVTCAAPYPWDVADWSVAEGYRKPRHPGRFKVVAYDFGIKYNILRQLTAVGCDVTVVPATTTAAEVLALGPHGVFLSNGPGDPQGVPYAAQATRELMGKVPIFGICLGNQIIGLALGATTVKLKFGHHGGNQPVQDLATGKVEITSQNHNFVVDLESLKRSEHGDAVEVTHLNLNDRTVEGMRHREYPLFSVQYHPEASPGPQDSAYLFRQFTELMEKHG